MWFEVIPSAIVIATCMVTPQYFSYFWNKYVFGNPYRRELHSMWDRHHFTRDARIGGAVWRIKGIENIPDGDD